MKHLVLAIVCAASYVHAAPALETYQGQGYSLQLPKGWKVTADASRGQLLAQQDPSRADAPQLLLMVRTAPAGVTDDQVLATASTGFGSGFSVVDRRALPGGRGKLVIAEGTSQGVTLRIAVAALVDNGYAEAAVLAAKPDELDVALVAQVITSLRIGKQSPVDAAIDQMKRSEKRTDHPDLDPDRPAVKIVGSWGRGSASSYRVEDSRSSTTSYGHLEGMGDGEVFAFRGNGTYEITKVSRVDGKICHSRATQIETGTYAFDGKRLTLTVKAAAGDYSNCGAKSVHEAVKQLPKPRSYDVGLATDGWLVLVGPACGAFSDLSCPEHAGWEMPPQR